MTLPYTNKTISKEIDEVIHKVNDIRDKINEISKTPDYKRKVIKGRFLVTLAVPENPANESSDHIVEELMTLKKMVPIFKIKGMAKSPKTPISKALAEATNVEKSEHSSRASASTLRGGKKRKHTRKNKKSLLSFLGI